MSAINIKIENDYVGYFEREFATVRGATDYLLEMIQTEWNWMLTEYPKSKFNIGFRNENEKWVQVYSISAAKARKFIKLGIL